MNPTNSPYIQIRKSKIHGNGVYAAKDIPKGTKIIEYVGIKLPNSDDSLDEPDDDPEKGKVYLFELDENYDIDGDVEWNTARYINHTCEPNCESDIIDGHIWIIALRDIKKGEELSYNYGYDFDDDWENHPCRCSSEKCAGYILDDDHWPKLKAALEKKIQSPR